MNVRFRAVVVLVVGLSCKRHEERAPSSSSAVPSASAQAASDPLGGVPSVAEPAPSASEAASAASTDAGLDEIHRARERALNDARDFGLLAALADDGGAQIGSLFGGVAEDDAGAFGYGRLGHRPVPSIVMEPLVVSGRLPPAVVLRVIRQRLGRIRLCYDDGLRANAALRGRVTTRLVIDKDGNVTSAKDSGSDLPDATVVSCVVRAFATMSFPQPDGGIVTVTSPIRFSPPSP